MSPQGNKNREATGMRGHALSSGESRRNKIRHHLYIIELEPSGRAEKIFSRRSEDSGEGPSRNDLRRGGHARPKRLNTTGNEAEYGRRGAKRAADSALRDANAARKRLPLMRGLLEPQWHLGVCIRTRVTIAR